jgi:lipopolysaccharide/colanic/teichoic acid biosynthesis glycosyltransferase
MKRSFDVAVSFIGLIVLLPFFIGISFLIITSSPGPVLYRQPRIGRFGKPFACIKFRTMVVGAEKQGPITSSTDSRITPIGRFLRRFKLDELPQLWNVFIGKMSFVGPRPDVPGYADKLEGDARRRILELRPGITGPASLYFRNEEELLATVPDPKRYNDEVIWPKKVALNLEYAENRSFWKDAGYILITIIPSLNKLWKLVEEGRLMLNDETSL